MASLDLRSTFLRLRADSTVESLPVDDTVWQRMFDGKLGNFRGEALVSAYDFAEDWPNWEMHPNGDEIVCLLAGAATLVLERPGGNQSIALGDSGAFAIVPKGTWHTARVEVPCRMLFITPGEGTQVRQGSSQ